MKVAGISLGRMFINGLNVIIYYCYGRLFSGYRILFLKDTHPYKDI